MTQRAFQRLPAAALTALFSLPVAAGAASMTIWDSTGYRGASTVIDDSVRSLSALGWNDRISSLRVESGRRR